MFLYKALFGLLFCTFFIGVSSAVYSATSTSEIFNLPLEALITLKVTAVSKEEETISDAPGIVSVITALEISQFGANNLQDLLRRIPGALPETSVSFPDNMVSIRGQQTTIVDRRVLLLLNGRPVRDTNSGGANATIYRNFPIDSIDRIEVIRGPGSVLYGSNAYSGVLNIITKKPKTKEGMFAAMAGAFDTYQGQISYAYEMGETFVYLSGQAMKTGGWEFKATDSPFFGTPVYGQADMEAEGSGTLLQLSRKGFSLNMYEGRLNQSFLGADQVWPMDYYDRHTQFIDIGYRHNISDKWYSDSNITYNRNNRSTENINPANEFDYDTYNIVYEVNLHGELSSSLSGLMGASYMSLSGDDNSGTESVRKFKDNWKSAYLQMNLRASALLQLSGGVQYNDTGVAEDFSYRASAIYHFNNKLGAKLLYGEAFLSPYMTDQMGNSVILGDQNLVPETIATVDAQLFYYSADYRLELTYFESKLEEQLAIVPNPDSPPLFRYINGEALEFSGVEFEARKQINPNFHMQGSYSYQENTTEQGVRDTQIVPNSMFKIGLGYVSSKGVSLGLFNTYYSDPADWSELAGTPVRNPDTGAYNHLSLNIDMPLSVLIDSNAAKNIELSLYGDNLLESDAIYWPDISRSQNNTWPKWSGRAIYLSIRTNL